MIEFTPNDAMGLAACLSLIIGVVAWQQKWKRIAIMFAVSTLGYWFAVLLNFNFLGFVGFGVMCAGLYALNEKGLEMWIL